MTAQEQTERLVVFFKALADENRLRIVGLLADKPCSVEELAAILQISSATVSHHLQRLSAAGLVEARALQYYNVYSLKQETLLAMAKQLSQTDSLKETAHGLDRDRYANNVLDAFITRGRLKTVPRQVKKRQVILDHIASGFQPGRRYSERQVNEILKPFHADFASLRRELMNVRLLARDHGYYRRLLPVEAVPAGPTGEKPRKRGRKASKATDQSYTP